MLSKIFSRAGITLAKNPSTCLRVVSAQLYSNGSPKSEIQNVNMNYPARMNDWENFKMPGSPYEGMGPMPPLPDYDKSLTRHYIIPETWFDIFRPRTGESGLYVLAAGFTTFLFSKEFIIYNPETWYVLSFIIAYTITNKLVGPYVSDYVEDRRVNELKYYDQVKNEELKVLADTVDEMKLQQWRAQGQDLINDARRSNLAMMLETEYLNRQATVADTVKKMLDYQVAVQKVETDLEQQHMVKWIENKVEATVTPQTQKATLNACIAQLNQIAAK